MSKQVASMAVVCLLAACAATNSRLPPLVTYTDAQQDQAAAELDGGACPMLAVFAGDYHVLRDQIRAGQ